MKLKLIKNTAAILTTLIFSAHTATASTACSVACDTAEAVGQVACVVAIFDEPECSIAVAAAYAACIPACNAMNLTVQPTVPAVVKSTITKSDLCNGKLTPKNKPLADKFCASYK